MANWELSIWSVQPPAFGYPGAYRLARGAPYVTLNTGPKLFRTKTILLVDDDAQLRRWLGFALRKNGYYVIEADSGFAGLEMARQHLPDLILSDIDMPGGDGTSLLRDIRGDPELKSRQFVLMSGNPDLGPPRPGMDEGADDFLVKPFSLHVLLSCIKSRLRRTSIGCRAEEHMAP